MKESFSVLTLFIPGPKAPGKDMDVFLRPMIEELKELWEHGIDTRDVEDGKVFRIRATLMWTINDFQAYGSLFRWSTKGYLACPT